MIKAHINKTKSIWKFENENDISDWDKFHDWKLWSSFKEKVLIIKTLINTQKLTSLLHAERKIAFIIFRFVRCTNVAFEILILLSIINNNLKIFYSLNFNSNEKSLQFFRRVNLNHAWFINDKIIEYKQYRFEKDLNEMKNTIRINRSNVSIESITTDTLLTLSSNVNYSTSVLTLSSNVNYSTSVIISTSTENRFTTTFSKYSVILSMIVQFSLFSKERINNNNKEKSSENHDFISLFRSFEITLVETTNIDMSSKNEKIKEYDEAAEHKKILIFTSAYKIVQLTLIEKRLDNTTVKLSKIWEKEIEFLKFLREKTDKERSNKITERINNLKNMIKELTEERNKLRNDVIEMFLVTTQRIFAHNDHNTANKIMRWSALTESIAKIFEIENVFSMQIPRSLLSIQINKSELTSFDTTRASFAKQSKQSKKNQSKRDSQSSLSELKQQSKHWHEFDTTSHHTVHQQSKYQQFESSKQREKKK